MNLPARTAKDSFASGPDSFRNIIIDLGEIFRAVRYSDLRNCLLPHDSGGEHRGIARKARITQSRRRPHR
jgi:hypothetical protein